MNLLRMSIALALAGASLPLSSQAVARTYDITISRQPLDEALKELAKQTGLQIARFNDTTGATSQVGPIAGAHSAQEALTLLLSDVGLSYRVVNDRTIAVVRATPNPVHMRLAQAQTDAQPTPAETPEHRSSVSIEEIVVTSQKREERLQDVPLSITAFGTQQMERMGVRDFADYARMVPGLAFTNGGPGQQEFYIRGISSVAGNPTTQFYIDETPQSASNAGGTQIRGADPRVFDMERLEVLRGPQGTLYGSSSMGGTIRVITNKPDAKQFSSKVETSASSTASGGENFSVSGMLNLPLLEDKLAVRIVGIFRDEGGFIERNEGPATGLGNPLLPRPLGGEFTSGSRDQDTEEVRGARIATQYKATDDLTVTATMFWQEVDQQNQHTIDSNRGGRLERGGPLDEPRRDEFTQYSLVLDWDLGFANLVSASSYLDRFVAERTDFTFLGARYNAGVPMPNERNNPFDVLTQEIRISSPDTGRFNYTAGLFYLEQDGGEDQTVRAPGFTAGSGIPTLNDILFDENTDSTETQLAVFGQASLRFLEKFEAVVGARWFDAEVKFVSAKDGIFNGGYTVTSGAAKDKDVTPKFGLNYRLDDAKMLYTSASKGFRIGRPNLFVPSGPCGAELAALGFSSIPTSIASDSLWQYEVGAKTAWQDNRVILNVGAYYIDWKDIPQQIPLDCGFSIALNVGEASSKGLELELRTRATERLELGLAASVTDAQLEKDAPDLGGKKGDRLQNVPEYMFAVNAQYTFPIFGDREGYIRGDYSYSGDSYQNFNFASNNFKRPSYKLANLRLGVESSEWEAAIFVENLFNELAIWNITSTDTFEYSINRPRTVGLTLRKQWQ